VSATVSKILYPRIVAVTRANPVTPGAAVEGFGGGLTFPHIDAAGDYSDQIPPCSGTTHVPTDDTGGNLYLISARANPLELSGLNSGA